MPLNNYNRLTLITNCVYFIFPINNLQSLRTFVFRNIRHENRRINQRKDSYS
jgi:hypothetical protein